MSGTVVRSRPDERTDTGCDDHEQSELGSVLPEAQPHSGRGRDHTGPLFHRSSFPPEIRQSAGSTYPHRYFSSVTQNTHGGI